MALSQNNEDENKKMIFSRQQLEKLEQELDDYESFDAFLEAKDAVELVADRPTVKRYRNLEDYWEKHVRGTDYYQVDHEAFMQDFYAPIRYWSLMRKSMKDRKRKRDYAEEKQLEDYEQIAQTVTN